MDILNIITLAFLGYIDYTTYKIPNVILVVWLGTIVTFTICGSTSVSIIPLKYLIPIVIASLLVAGSYFPISLIVNCNAGDFKLFGVLTLAKGLDDTLIILFLSNVIALVLILAGGVKKVPLAFITFFGYIAFLIFKMEGFI